MRRGKQNPLKFVGESISHTLLSKQNVVYIWFLFAFNNGNFLFLLACFFKRIETEREKKTHEYKSTQITQKLCNLQWITHARSRALTFTLFKLIVCVTRHSTLFLMTIFFHFRTLNQYILTCC